jgi:hypothetical protein
VRDNVLLVLGMPGLRPALVRLTGRRPEEQLVRVSR